MAMTKERRDGIAYFLLKELFLEHGAGFEVEEFDNVRRKAEAVGITVKELKEFGRRFMCDVFRCPKLH